MRVFSEIENVSEIINIRILSDDHQEECEDLFVSESTQHSVIVNGYEVVGEDQYHDLSVEAPPESDDTLYLVTVTYDTGDSFSSDLGKKAFVMATSNKDLAWDNARAIEAHIKKIDEYDRLTYSNPKKARKAKSPGFTIPIRLTKDIRQDYYGGGFLGYFENSQVVNVEPIKRIKND